MKEEVIHESLNKYCLSVELETTEGVLTSMEILQLINKIAEFGVKTVDELVDSKG